MRHAADAHKEQVAEAQRLAEEEQEASHPLFLLLF